MFIFYDDVHMKKNLGPFMLKTQNTNFLWRTVRVYVCFDTSDVPAGAHLSHHDIIVTSPSCGGVFHQKQPEASCRDDDTFSRRIDIVYVHC